MKTMRKVELMEMEDGDCIATCTGENLPKSFVNPSGCAVSQYAPEVTYVFQVESWGMVTLKCYVGGNEVYSCEYARLDALPDEFVSWIFAAVSDSRWRKVKLEIFKVFFMGEIRPLMEKHGIRHVMWSTPLETLEALEVEIKNREKKNETK